MEATLDSAGRVLLPKHIRKSLGLSAGSKVEITAYGAGVQIIPSGRTAKLVREPGGRLVAKSEAFITDEDIFGLIDSSRR